MTLRIGARGAAVTTVQERLTHAGAHLAVDGRYGRETATAVREFQRSHHLRRDGVVGPATARAMGLSDGFDAAPRGSSGAAPRAPVEHASSGAPGRAPPPPPPPSSTAAAPAPLLSPQERELSPVAQATLAADRLSSRLEEHARRGEPVPRAEAAIARAHSGNLDQVRMPIGSDAGEFSQLASAAGRLRAAVAAMDR